MRSPKTETIIAQKLCFVHKWVVFVHFIWLCAQKVVPLQPIFKIHIIYIYNLWL